MSEDWVLAKVFLGCVLFIGALVALVSWSGRNEQRECVRLCLDARFRETEATCAFYCAYGRPKESTPVVVPVPVVVPQ